jgi:TM2 domain-containing membrane protein YozV
MKRFLLVAVLIFCLSSEYSLASGGRSSGEKLEKAKLVAGLQQGIGVRVDSGGFFDVNWTGRKVTALILSSFVPGTGQSYLGNTTKGALITLAAFGSVLTAALSHNNFIAGNERLESLEVDYRNATNYRNADRIWNTMVNVKRDLDKDHDRRNLFVGVSAGLWVLNIVDVIFLTDDLGERPFGSLLRNDGIQIGLDQVDQQVALSVQIPISF